MAAKSSPYHFKYVERTGLSIADIERQMGACVSENTLSKEQREVFDKICRWYEYDADAQQVLTLGGYAGTGKSTLVSVLASKYIDESIGFCAFTGKATSVLRSKLYEANVPGHHDVKTVHSMMYRPVVDLTTGSVSGWAKRAVLDYDLLIVDEASMLEERVFTDLCSYGIPILAVGDHGQLPPVYGNFNLMEKPQLRLDFIHRQAQDSPILALSEFVRRIGQIPRMENSLEVQILKSHQRQEVIESLFTTPNVKYNDVGLLCYTNATRNELNARARLARWGDRFDEAPLVGDQVMCLRNVEGTIFNGMRGELTHCSDDTVHHYTAKVLFEEDEIEVSGPVCKVQFGLDRTIKDFVDFASLTNYETRDWDSIGLLMDFGYALTIHKSQGSQMDHVIVCANDFPQRLDFDTKKRALYTAVTRCSKYLVVLQ